MTISATTMQRLLALKLDPEPMAEVLSIIAEAVAGERGKALPVTPNALRQRRWRERHKKRYEPLQSVTEASQTVTNNGSHYNSENNLLTSQTDINLPKNNGVKALRSNGHSKPKNRIEYPPPFQIFWNGYPVDRNMAKAEALPVWNKLSPEDQDKAIASLPAFNDYCAKHPDYRPIHAVRYLKYRRFDSFAEGKIENGNLTSSQREALKRQLAS